MAAKKEAKKEKEKEKGLVVVEEEGRRDMVRFAQRAESPRKPSARGLPKKKGGGGRGTARRGPGKPWIRGGEKESTLAVITLFE